MEIVENYIVNTASLLGQFLVHPHLRRQIYHRNSNFALPGRLDGLGDVARIAGGQAAHDDDHFPAGVGGHVLQGGEDQLEGILEGGLPTTLTRRETFNDLLA